MTRTAAAESRARPPVALSSARTPQLRPGPRWAWPPAPLALRWRGGWSTVARGC